MVQLELRGKGVNFAHFLRCPKRDSIGARLEFTEFLAYERALKAVYRQAGLLVNM